MSDEPLTSMFKKVKDRITDEVSLATNKIQNMQIIDQLAASVQASEQPSCPPNKVHFSLTGDNLINTDNQLVDDDDEDEQFNSENSPRHQLSKEKSIKQPTTHNDIMEVQSGKTNQGTSAEQLITGGKIDSNDLSSSKIVDTEPNMESKEQIQLIAEKQPSQQKQHSQTDTSQISSNSNNNRHTLIAMLKESIKLKNSQIKTLKSALGEVEKFKGLGDELRKELHEIKNAHERWTVSIAENKRVVHHELEMKNVEVIRLKNEINEYQSKLHDSNTIIRQLKTNIQDLGSKLVSTSAAHEKERETLTRDLTMARNNAIRQVQKEHEHHIERVKLELEKSIEALKMALLTKDKELMDHGQIQQQMAQHNRDLQYELERCNDKFTCQTKQFEDLKQKHDQLVNEIKEIKEVKEVQVKEMTNSETMTDEEEVVDKQEMTKDVESEYLKNVSKYMSIF